MQSPLKMPDLTTNESPLRIVRWLVTLGDTVTPGQPLLEVETDKATVEVEAARGGRLVQLLCQRDEQVSVGQTIAILEDVASAPAGESRGTDCQSVLHQPAAGMFARNRAAADARKAAAAGVALSVAQRTAAQRLQTSKQTIPHFYLQTSFNAAAILARRQGAEPRPPAWDAFFVLAVARALIRFARFRNRWDGGRLVPADSDAIGVAVDLDDELFVIPIAVPSGKTAGQISENIRRGIDRLRAGDQEARRIRPALLTVTNLGMCNVESFVPIINPPEPAILGVGRMQLTPIVNDGGAVVVQPRCTLTLSVDHRVANGKYAAEFLGAIVAELEAM